MSPLGIIILLTLIFLFGYYIERTRNDLYYSKYLEKWPFLSLLIIFLISLFVSCVTAALFAFFWNIYHGLPFGTPFLYDLNK